MGNALQVYAVDRTRGAVRALARLAPDEVLVLRDGAERLVPAKEVAAVRELAAGKGATGMVGDGINDAPALAAADVALEAAGVALMRDDLRKLAEAVRFSRSSERIIKQNVLVSILFKGVFVLLAPLGLVTLWLAVLADMGTSLAVTGNGLRLFKKRSV